MKADCELRKRPSLLAILAAPFLIVILLLCLIFSLNLLIQMPHLNGLLVITALVAALAAPLALLMLQTHIFVEKHGPTFSIHRRVLLLNRVISSRSIPTVDDVFWKKHDHLESDGVRYELYARVRTENDSLADARDISVLGGVSLFVTLTKAEVDAFRIAFRNLSDAS